MVQYIFKLSLSLGRAPEAWKTSFNAEAHAPKEAQPLRTHSHLHPLVSSKQASLQVSHQFGCWLPSVQDISMTLQPSNTYIKCKRCMWFYWFLFTIYVSNVFNHHLLLVHFHLRVYVNMC